MRRPHLPAQPPWLRAALDRPRVRRGLLLTRRSVREFSDDHCAQLAAAISYHLLFSIFPLAIAGIGVLGLVTRSAHARDQVVNQVLKFIPLSSNGQSQLHSMLASISGATGALGLLGILGVIWAATGVMSAVRTAVNIAWDVDEHRPFLRGKAVDLLLLLATFVMVGAAMGVALLSSLARRTSGDVPSWLTPITGPLAAAFAAAATFALLFGTYVSLYRLLPTVQTKLREVWLGAAVAAAGVTGLQYGFSVYVSHFSHYNRIYGSLGAIVAFMFFVYLASAVFLFGAEVASELPRLPPRSGTAVDERRGRRRACLAAGQPGACRGLTRPAQLSGARTDEWTVWRTPWPLPNIAPNAIFEVSVQVSVSVLASGETTALACTSARPGSRVR